VSPRQVNELRAALGLGDGPVLGVFGRLAPWKGQHVLLDALAELADVPNLQALVVGDALFGEADYAKSLRRKAEALGLGGRVRFLGFRDDVPALMRLADIVVHTSVAPEPFGRVVVEGMLAGRPVVATRGGGVVEIVEDGVTGLLTEPGDARSLAAAVRGLLGDAARRQSIATRGQRFALQHFGVRATTRAVREQVIETLRLGTLRRA
jgi:glycosyltransferase involved in cell wall biosynthesis